MGISEFALIKRYFSDGMAARSDVLLGVGDDAALLLPAAGQSLALSLDTLVAGVHFPVTTSAENIGYKTLAVNLSDMAAMGAEPAWMLLGLTLPTVDELWLQGFCYGLSQLAAEHQVALVGGDTTRGPLTISLQICGFVPASQALRRDGAQAGDLIYVTGQLGDAGVGLQLALARCELMLEPNRRDYFISRLERPTPRVAAGLALRGVATAAIDISDGLAGDLGHILTASGVGATLNVDALPVAVEVKALSREWWDLPLTAGDDYELCFTVPAGREPALERALRQSGCAVTCIGQIETEPGLRLQHDSGEAILNRTKGYQHFV
ncbi:MAG: thiamine-phosphate kinase [Pseudomonadota bacterium]|nr:thiamine-phosphate kinase [Pseudomonadota bacterium]